MAHRPVRLALAALLAVAAWCAPAVAPAATAPAVKSAVVALALWSDPVFRSEAEGAASVLARRYGNGGPVVVRSNTRATRVNGPEGIAAALRLGARGLDPGRDVLILLLTSHGAPDGIADKGGGVEELVPPDRLAHLLAGSPVRHKVLIVSACFSGTYTALAGPDTLVLTAADSTHPSFGCQPEAHWTYFGDALFNQALRRDGSLPAAFAAARAIVARREAAQGFAPSNPQIAGGAAVLPLLDAAAGRPAP